VCFVPISSRAVALSITSLHQQPDHDSSHANACPHASQRDGRFSVGPEGVHWKTKVTISLQSSYGPETLESHRRHIIVGAIPRQ
jgi:hypothetical protein